MEDCDDGNIEFCSDNGVSEYPFFIFMLTPFCHSAVEVTHVNSRRIFLLNLCSFSRKEIPVTWICSNLILSPFDKYVRLLIKTYVEVNKTSNSNSVFC